MTWLLSEGARYVTGSTITVDGGSSNVKASMTSVLKFAYDEAWPQYGRNAVPQPSKEALLKEEGELREGKLGVPTGRMSFPTRMLDAAAAHLSKL